MDSLTASVLIAAAPTGLGLLAAIPLGLAYERIPRRIRARALGREVRRRADEYERSHPKGRPAPRRHNAHCPACGRFAHVTSAGEWGVRTRCKAHGVKLRRARIIGEHERPALFGLAPYRPIVALPALRLDQLEAPDLREAMRPWRAADWLDRNDRRADELADLMRTTPLRAIAA